MARPQKHVFVCSQYSAVNKEDVATIFDQHLIGGTPVERLRAPADIW